MSNQETQIDWALKEFGKAGRAVEKDSGLYHIAVGLSHLSEAIKGINHRIFMLEKDRDSPERDD